MTVKLYGFTVGHLTIPWSFMVDGREGAIKVPVPSYVVVHPTATAVFDSGLNVAALRDPAAHVGEFLAAFHTFDFVSGEELGAQLDGIEFGADRIDLVINSHLHFDHAGGNGQFPRADVLVQQAEWDAAHVDDAQLRGYVAADFDTGQEVRRVVGDHDVFGDGSVRCIPTPGHTPGHQCLVVQTEHGGEVVLCADACYLRESLESLLLPGVISDPVAALQTLHRFRDLQASGSRVLFGHDPEFWKSVPHAPARIG